MPLFYRCLFIIEPSSLIKKHIRCFKHISKDVIGSFLAFNSTAHITLLPEQKLTIYKLDYFAQQLEPVINNLNSIKIDLDGFGTFNNHQSYTFFSRIKPFNLTKNWFDYISKLLHHSIEPHITIARGLNKAQLNSLLLKFKETNYKDSFTPIGITILIKDWSDPDAEYQIYKTLYFKNYKFQLTTEPNN
jgi:2'-5' RNA ligase